MEICRQKLLKIAQSGLLLLFKRCEFESEHQILDLPTNIVVHNDPWIMELFI